MKNIITVFLIFISISSFSQPGNFEIKLVNNGCGEISVQARCTDLNNYPTAGSDFWVNINFTIRWTQNVDLTGWTGIYNLVPEGAGRQYYAGTGHYFRFFSMSTFMAAPETWTQNQWYEIMKVQNTKAGSGVDNFELGDAAWVALLPRNATNMDLNGNGDSASNAGNASGVYVEPVIEWDGIDWCGGTGTNNQPSSTDGAKNCYVHGANGVLTVNGAIVNQLNIATGADLTIDPGASLTANGATSIADPASLVIAASASGVGSFIDNGTINYGASGSAAVETYLSNSGTYYFHQVGPTVDNLPSGSGVTLADFDISMLNTFAYEWNEPTQAWDNPYLLTYPINTGTGLMLTTDNGTAGEYDQIGALVNTNVNLNLIMSGDPATGSYGWNLKSNPFSASLDWDLSWTREDPISTSDLNPTIYVLNNGIANYASYNASTNVGTGMTKDVQVGQGFWLQYVQNPYTAPGNINITLQTSDRVHSTAAFLKSSIFDQLTLTASGNNSADILAIAFREYGSYTYDVFADVDKWESYWEDATEIWTVSQDNKFLTHNILPTLSNAQVSVPMSFECHTIGEYTITASDIESFLGNVEIYLEDLVEGGEWHNLVMDNTYTFTGNPEDNQARFIVHFFGTTGLDDPKAIEPISIYSWGQDAYIVNRGNETIKEYVAYDMMGRELHRGTLPNNTVNKVQIGNVSAYYIVKVITKEGGVYTDKVYITK